MLTPRRRPGAELLDESDFPSDDVLRSLRDLRAINRWLGGRRAYRGLLRHFGPGPFEIADLGTGTSDLLAAVPARRRLGLDFKIQHLAFGMKVQQDDVARIAADAFRIPLRDGSVDLVTSSHFFHHFSEEENAQILRESLRIARLGVAITDTRRHYAPLLFMEAAGALRLIGPITRADGPASVRQGYTIEEARDAAESVGARRVKVIRQLPFRFGLLLWK